MSSSSSSSSAARHHLAAFLGAAHTGQWYVLHRLAHAIDARRPLPVPPLPLPVLPALLRGPVDSAAAYPDSTSPASNSASASASASIPPASSPPRRAAISALGASALHYTIAYPFRAATLRALQRALGDSDNVESNTVNAQRGIANANGNASGSGSSSVGSSVGSSVRTEDSQRPTPPHQTHVPLRLDTAGVARLLCATAAPAALPMAASERDECLVALLFLLYIRSLDIASLSGLSTADAADSPNGSNRSRRNSSSSSSSSSPLAPSAVSLFAFPRNHLDAAPFQAVAGTAAVNRGIRNGYGRDDDESSFGLEPSAQNVAALPFLRWTILPPAAASTGTGTGTGFSTGTGTGTGNSTGTFTGIGTLSTPSIITDSSTPADARALLQTIAQRASLTLPSIELRPPVSLLSPSSAASASSSASASALLPRRSPQSDAAPLVCSIPLLGAAESHKKPEHLCAPMNSALACILLAISLVVASFPLTHVL